MAGSATDYLEALLLNHSLGISSYAFSSTRWLALYTVSPTDAATGTEVSGGAGPYARKSVVFATSLSISTNTTVINFTGMPACTVVAIAVTDALTGGNILFYSTFVPPKTLVAGDTLSIPIGSLSVSLD